MSTLFQTTLQNLNQVQQATQAIPPPPILPPYKQTFFQPNNQNLTPNPPLFSSFVNQHAPPPLMQQGAYNAHNLLINSDKLAQVQEFYNENIDDYDDYNDDEDDEINILEEKNKKKTGETIQTAFSTNEKKNFETNLTEQSSKRQNIGQKNEQFELIAQKNKFESLNKKNESSSKTNDLKKVSTAEDTTKIIQNKELKNIETNLNANNQNFKTGPLSSKTNFIFNTSSNLEQSARTTLFNLESTKTSKPEKKEDKQSNNEKVSSKCLSFDAKSSNAATSLSASQLEHDEEMNENPEDYEPDIEFKPLVKLEQVELKTGEEDEEVILKQRCKLYKFDITSKEWKEKGIGDMKILKHKTKNTYRLLMRRDQVLKVCLNQKIVPEIKFEIQSDKYIQWIANDFSEGKTVQETLLAKFKNESDALKFLSELNKIKSFDEKSNHTEIHDENKVGLKDSKPLSELFKTESKWTCETCLVLNDKSQNICSCCNSQKDGTSPSITSEGIQLKVEDKSKYIFGNISNNLLTNGASNFQFTFGSMPKLDENTTVKSESTNKVSNEPTSVFSFSSNNFLVPFGSSNTEYSIINSTNDQQKVFQQNLNSTNSTVAPKAVNSFSSIGSNTLTASSSSIYSTPVTSSSTSLQKMEDENKENNAFIQNNNFNEVSNISVKIEENTQNQRISKYETESYSSDVLVSAAYPEIFENTIDIQPLKVNKVEYYDFVKKQSELNTSVAGNFSGANSNESDGMVYN